MNKLKSKILFLFFFLLLNEQFFPQGYATLTGRILNSNTGRPVSNVNIYIANSTTGTTSNRLGRYKLIIPKPGKYKIIISAVGYDRIVKRFTIAEKKEYRYTFELSPKIYELPTVLIDEEEKEIWQERLEIFKKQFIGTSHNAEHCELENPYVLDFYEHEGGLSAKAQEPLLIKNYSLGYEIKYFLEYFYFKYPNTYYKGLPIFTEMYSDDSLQIQRWEAARLKTYCGSLRHFLYASSKDYDERMQLINSGIKLDTAEYKPVLERQGFLVYKFKIITTYRMKGIYSGIESNDFIYPTDNIFEKYISFKDALEVIYTRKKEDQNYLDFIYQNRWTKNPVSHILLHDDSVRFDIYGRSFEEFKIQTLDYWAFERVADLLPFEYSVPDSVLEKVDFEE